VQSWIGFLKPQVGHINRFPKASRRHINGFPRASAVDSFCGFFNTVCRGFSEPVHVVISAHKNPFITAVLAFEVLSTNRIRARGFSKIRQINKSFQRITKKDLD
jgi:hypothetical protein